MESTNGYSKSLTLATIAPLLKVTDRCVHFTGTLKPETGKKLSVERHHFNARNSRETRQTVALQNSASQGCHTDGETSAENFEIPAKVACVDSIVRVLMVDI